MATRGELKAILAQQVGDALTTGSPAYLQGSGFKYSQPIYNSSMDFAVELLREMFCYPVNSVLFIATNASYFIGSIVNQNIVNVQEILMETVAGEGIFETEIPLNIVT